PVVTSLDYSPDGKLLAVAGFHEVLLHQANGSGLVARLVGLSERIESVKFSPDGKRLAVAGGLPGRMGEVQIWDVEKRKLALSHSVTYDTLYGASWSPDGKLIAFGCADNRRMIHVVTLLRIGRRVIHRALRDPTADQLDFYFVQRLAPLGHLGLAVLGCDELEEVGFLRRLRDDGGEFGLARLHEQAHLGHHILTARLGRLMATLTVRLKNGADVLVITDLLGWRGLLLRRRRGEPNSGHCQHTETDQNTFAIHSDKLSPTRRRSHATTSGGGNESRRPARGEIHRQRWLVFSTSMLRTSTQPHRDFGMSNQEKARVPKRDAGWRST
ncbi:MAG: WD40 repeat domain-containing protein, partial [Verrucomicrobia bacterium]|nr:WD40 repeat domain-containing protein [Verrucomicrobiota bacterium]